MNSQVLYESPQQSPVEEDISRAGTFAYAEAGASSPTSRTQKQKQKQRAEGPFADDAAEDSSDENGDASGSYPPLNDEVEEARRIEEVRLVRRRSWAHQLMLSP